MGHAWHACSITDAYSFDFVINLLDVAPERSDTGVQVRLSDQAVAIDQGFAGSIGSECVLGIRPEAIRFVDENTPGSFPVTVEAETPLNEKTITLVHTARGREVMVSRPAGTPGPDHGKAYVAVDASNALLFDRASGNRIEPEALLQGAAA
ncbi:MAG: TOBE domain-containing protein [Rhizobiales bacterium]|nr:TOBE domain-containing protein [Hyphomicrobiales bacterium]